MQWPTMDGPELTKFHNLNKIPQIPQKVNNFFSIIWFQIDFAVVKIFRMLLVTEYLEFSSCFTNEFLGDEVYLVSLCIILQRKS